ncbi:hypothetical protein B0J12DRAFT_637923 [Macrophomina phaseolina]|uniref:Secreted protein n=1 Tax=Macrophomina phaseolina TaxID=35725 RepID=A0ABQ8GU35_9PEZI|nr:hypothetical protein B0J12DRAFT_637923 [Macrophomina phaseolina]
MVAVLSVTQKKKKIKGCFSVLSFLVNFTRCFVTSGRLRNVVTMRSGTAKAQERTHIHPNREQGDKDGGGRETRPLCRLCAAEG